MDQLKTKIDKDAKLVERLKNKEERAFTILVDKYKSPLFFYIYGIVRNTLDAEDLTMITFTKVFTSIDSYTPDFFLSTWLFRIARNTSFDFIRISRNKLYKDLDLEYMKNFIDSDTLNAEQIIMNNESFKILRKKIKNVNPLYQKIIVLKTRFGYTFREIEETFGITINSASHSMRKVRRELSGRLG